MKKIIVGLSGGVDSSVVAFLLKQDKKYKVEAAFMRNWDSILNNDILGNKNLNNHMCSQEQDYQDAQKVCNQLDLKIHRIDFIEQYWNNVFVYFIDEYKNGRTPNPDILCNKYIKFHEFLNYAIDNYNADYIAMGHYARIIFNSDINEYQLLKAKDLSKDQTYFLCQLNQKQLSKTLFPIGDYLKSDIRKIANKNNLFTANKKDSTGVCFIGERDFKKFLKNYIPSLPGNILDINTRKVIGKHDGVMYYTIGQHKGLNLGGMKNKYYVIGKNINNKHLYVTSKLIDKWLYADSCIINNFNFINKIFDQVNFKCDAVFRYRQLSTPVEVTKLKDGNYKINFSKKIKSVTTGQFAVFYNGDVCIGGATIIATFNDKIKLEYY